MSRNFTCCAMQTFSGFPQRKPFSPPLTQDRYGSGVPLGGSDIQGMGLNQNAFLPLLLGNPDFLKLYMENPLLASQYVTLLMRGNVCQIIQKACTCLITCFQLLSSLCCPPKIYIVHWIFFKSKQILMSACVYYLSSSITIKTNRPVVEKKMFILRHICRKTKIKCKRMLT